MIEASAEERTGRAPARERPRLRLGYVDVLRALCALYVVAQHTWLTVRYHAAAYGHAFGRPLSEATAWMTFGYYAVTAFIVISGFSLATSMRRGSLLTIRGSASYIGRRARRLIPP